jgi:hypothetical protein
MEAFQPFMNINNNPLALSCKADLQNSGIKIGSNIHDCNSRQLDTTLPKYSLSKVNKQAICGKHLGCKFSFFVSFGQKWFGFV